MDITQTAPAFGSVEAYAKRRRRSVNLIGTGIVLSLQQSAAAGSSPSLGRLAEGTPFTLQLLSDVVSSLRGLPWDFRKSDGTTDFELVTISDNIEVILSCDEATNETFKLEGRLRGMAARLAVALEYVS
jgi:hypothetical protein